MTICVLDRFLADRFELDKGPLELDCRRHRHVSHKEAERRVLSGEWRWVEREGDRPRITPHVKTSPLLRPKLRDASAIMGKSVIEANAFGSHHAMQLVEALREQEHR